MFAYIVHKVISTEAVHVYDPFLIITKTKICIGYHYRTNPAKAVFVIQEARPKILPYIHSDVFIFCNINNIT